MKQHDEMIDLIKTMRSFLNEKKMKVEQIPKDDLLTLLSQKYNSICNAADTEIAVDIYRELIEKCIHYRDHDMMSALLGSILVEDSIISSFQNEKKNKQEMMAEAIMYRVETFYFRNRERNHLNSNRNTGCMFNPVFNGKGAVYSAVTGNYDNIHEPEYIDETLDYYMFTDSEDVSSKIWNIIKVENTDDLDPTRLARKIKILGSYDFLSDYDYTIWCDGKVKIIGDVKKYISDYSEGASIICFNHYFNDDIYQEAEHCISLKKDDPDIIKRQVERYRMEGFPEHYGIIESCFLIRDSHDELLERTMHDWWNEVRNGSKRDQLSFNYVCWKNGLMYDTSPLVSLKNDVVMVYEHK